MFIYVAAAVLSILIGNIIITPGGEAIVLKHFIYEAGLQPLLGNYPGSLIFALLFVGVNWIIGHYLYKKHIYIKI